MKNKSILLMLVCCFFAQVKAQKQPVDYVNTIIGATTAADGKMFAYDGKTFPGAATPFGSIKSRYEDRWRSWARLFLAP